jgi:hypothetical protein
MKSLTQAALFLLCFNPVTLRAVELVDGRSSLIFENSKSRLVIDLAGGSYREFRFLDGTVNPFNWGQPRPGVTNPKVMGHFLCLDRWGPPSVSEGANGMPYHGEAGSVVWQVDEEVHSQDGAAHASMHAMLPLAGIGIRRSIQVAADQPVALIRETVTNRNKLGRPYNMVQHPSIAPPFLTENTVVDANGRKGFAQGGTLPNPEEPSFHWPQALNRDGGIVNLRHLHGDHDPGVTSFAIDEPIGWVTAATPETGLLIGYLWPTADYPWLDIWRNSSNGKPSARGLEFGTTGLHQPFPVLMEKGRIFGRTIFEYLDANESATKRFAVFLLRIPADFVGVGDVRLTSEEIVVTERRESGARTLTIPLNGLDLGFH